jgi:hypothetical protein
METDPLTLAALRGSIAKWEAIVAGTGADGGRFNCPLCTMFWDNNCKGCPVRTRTGIPDCQRSPYERYSHHRVLTFYHTPCPECTRRAQAELDFLCSLLPPEAAP